jgi:hypothetical protein
MSYTNQCHYMKVSGDDGNPANGPDLIDVDHNPGVQGFSPSEQPTILPTRERSHTGPYMPSHGLVPHPPFPAYVPSPDMDVGSNNDLSGTSPDGPSNRPTPNSSTTGASSEQQQRQNLAAAAAAANGHGSGRNSFETSPVSSHQNLSSMSGTTPSDVEGGVNAFFGDPSSFGMTGLTPDSRFGMPGAAAGAGGASGGAGGGAGGAGAGGAEFAGHAAAAWAEMAGQQGMTNVAAEGMLRSIMAMGQMEGMDMGWEPSA